jgi:hypothetical protein
MGHRWDKWGIDGTSFPMSRWNETSLLNVLPQWGVPKGIAMERPERFFVGIIVLGGIFFCAAFALWMVG